MEGDQKKGHVKPLPINSITENVVVRPKVTCNNSEVQAVISDLRKAVIDESYKPAIPTSETPSLSDDFIFDKEDEKNVLQSLELENFVGKAIDLSKGAKKRKALGLPQEYLYVFKYPCELIKRDSDKSGTNKENVLIYIKINDRTTPYQAVFVVSFHRNNPIM